ncbi:hypothetical protein [Sphingobium sp. CR28]|uniref:hypothetical protein n=1 Tax=Sphingobium sp. CR28 TaxID=3400272 RepID=UPI003FEDCD38
MERPQCLEFDDKSRLSGYDDIADVQLARHHALMNVACFVPAGFFLTGIVFLAVVCFGTGGVIGIAAAFAATVPFSALIMFGMKCPHCGVSYYFAPSKGGSNVTGVNMFKPVAGQCRKCGSIR